MLGAIIGDMAGSTREFRLEKPRTRIIPLIPADSFFTDDTVMTCAVTHTALSWLRGAEAERTEEGFKTALVREMQRFGTTYENRGYGRRFEAWLRDPQPQPYNSWGNGSAMRVSAVGWLASDLDGCRTLARWSAEVTHNHPEGVKGAEATAVAVFLARKHPPRGALRDALAEYYPELKRKDFTVDRLHESYSYDVSCQGTVPQALECFLESNSFVSALSNILYIGGDCDTSGAIAGSVAEAYYGIPTWLTLQAYELLESGDEPRLLCAAVQDFYRRTRA